MLKKIVLSMLVAMLAVGSVSGFALAAAPAEEVGEKDARLVYGEVISVEEDGFWVLSFQGEEISFLINEETRFRRGTFADLQPGVKVAVASRSGEEEAIIVAILPPDFEPGGRFAIRVRGVVTAIDCQVGKFRIQAPDGGIHTFFVDEKTRYGGQLEDLLDMQVGWRAGVAAREEDEGKKVATVVIAGERPLLIKLRGTVTAVNNQAGKFRIQTPDGEIHTFFVDEKTRYGGQLEDLSDMQVGWRAGVAAREESEGKKVANVVIAGERPLLIKLRGTVTAVDAQAGKFRIQTPEGEIHTFFVDEKTRYGGQLEDLSDMQVGWRAGVAALEDADGKLLAKWVIAGAPRHVVKARGEIMAVDPGLGKFRLKKVDGTVLTYFVDDATRFKGQAHSIGDLQIGWKAGVAAVKGEDGHMLARLVIAGKPCAERPPEDADYSRSREDFRGKPLGDPFGAPPEG
jgi:hypothetical protein